MQWRGKFPSSHTSKLNFRITFLCSKSQLHGNSQQKNFPHHNHRLRQLNSFYCAVTYGKVKICSFCAPPCLRWWTFGLEKFSVRAFQIQLWIGRQQVNNIRGDMHWRSTSSNCEILNCNYPPQCYIVVSTWSSNDVTLELEKRFHWEEFFTKSDSFHPPDGVEIGWRKEREKVAYLRQLTRPVEGHSMA